MLGFLTSALPGVVLLRIPGLGEHDSAHHGATVRLRAQYKSRYLSLDIQCLCALFCSLVVR